MDLREHKSKASFLESPVSETKSGNAKQSRQKLVAVRKIKKEPAVDYESMYTVEDVLDHRTNEEGGDEYLVKWEGYDASQNSWEYKDSFSDPKKIGEFERRCAAMAKKYRIQEPENQVRHIAGVAPAGYKYEGIDAIDALVVFMDNTFESVPTWLVKKYAHRQLLEFHEDMMDLPPGTFTRALDLQEQGPSGTMNKPGPSKKMDEPGPSK